jgi:hypothetical protein
VLSRLRVDCCADGWSNLRGVYPGGARNRLTVRPSRHLGLGHRRAVLMKPTVLPAENATNHAKASPTRGSLVLAEPMLQWRLARQRPEQGNGTCDAKSE